MKRIFNGILMGIMVGLLALPTASFASELCINVSTVGELYSAVNDPSNRNVVVKLKSGLYGLTATDPDGKFYPNGGRLVLQPGMSLVGQNKYRDSDHDGVWDTLDGSVPTPESIFVVPRTETSIDGLGISSAADDQGNLIVVSHDNLVKNLTIKNMPYADFALIGSSAENRTEKKSGFNFRVRNCLLENVPGDGIATIGIDCANIGSGLDRAKSSCHLRGNIARNLPNVGSTPDGFKIRNDGANNAEICATLKGNRAFNIPGRPPSGEAPKTGHGLSIYGTDYFGGNDCKINVVSIRNVYSECGVGTVIWAAGPLGPPFVPFTISSSGNTVHVLSIKDQNINNYTQGGVSLSGAYSIGGEAYENKAVLKMFGTDFISDDGQPENTGGFSPRQDLLAFGAGAYLGFGTVKNNKATLLLVGATSDNGAPSFFIVNNDPDNEMKLIGSEEMVEKWNKGVDLVILE